MVISSIAGANEQQYKKPGFLACAGGIVAGLAVSGLPIHTSNFLIPKFEKSGFGFNKTTKDEFQQIDTGIAKALKESGLSDKGISVIRYSPQTKDEIKTILNQETASELKFLPKSLRKVFALTELDDLKEGKNARWAPVNKKLVMPEKELVLTTFHEMGHASNSLSTAGRILQKSRLSILACPIILLTSLLKTKKSPNKEQDGGFDKFTDFIKNNAGKLTFLSAVPVLVEEGLASIKGMSYAKKVLDPALVKKLSKDCRYGFLTYLATVTAISVGTALGVKAKDAIAKPKPIDSENKS